MLVVEGDAGVGKSTLVARVVETARARHIRVLQARPAETEAGLAHAGLHDLLGDLDRAELDAMPAPQRFALDVALFRATPVEPGPDAAAIAVATLSALRTLASATPCLVVIDDSQWLDPSTANALRFAWRRMQSEHVGTVLVRRTTDGAEPGDPEVAPGTWRHRLVLGPLSVGAIHRLIHDRLGVTLPRPRLVRLHARSGGNPNLALELVRAFGADGPPLEAELPMALDDLTRRRLERLPAELRPLLELVAIGGRVPRSAIADVLGLPAASVDAGIVIAEAEALVTVDRGVVRIAHPVLAASLRARLSDADRRAAHARAALTLQDPIDRVRHAALAAIGPDPAMATGLDSAATETQRRGAAAEAVELRQMAIDRTDPADAASIATRRLALAETLFTAGDTARAADLLQSLVDGLPAGPQRADAHLLLATIRWYAGDEVGEVDAAQRALADAAADPGRLGRIHARLSWMFDFDLGRQAEHARAAMALLDPAVDPDTYAFALLNGAWVRLLAGEAADHEAIQRGDAMQAHGSGWEYSTLPANWAKAMDQHDLARERLAGYLERARAVGDDSSVAQLLAYRAELECWVGSTGDAMTLAEEAVELAQQTEQDVSVALALARRALVHAYRGDHAAAWDDARRALDRSPPPLLPPAALGVIGYLHLVEGDPGAADAALTRADTMLAGIGMREPAPYRFAPDHIEAVIQLGDLSRAERLLAILEQRGKRVPRPWISITSARCRGLLAAARGDTASAMTALESALADHPVASLPMEEGRTQVAYGVLLRRIGRRSAARAALEAAVATFERLGCATWVERTRREIERLGTAPSVEDGLTPSEERIARLAASGLRNRQIADRLSISPKTVEANLARAYHKLGIHSRAELGAAVARGAIDGPAADPSG